MARLTPAVAVATLALLAACGGGSTRETDHRIGDESFVSSPPGGGGRGGPVGAGDEAGGFGNPAPPSSDSGDQARAVEESDLYARLGSTLLVQNAWRGLQLLDLSDPAKPTLLARLPLSGTPAGLYLRGTTALVLARDHLSWTMAEDGPSAAPGSRLWVVDVSDPAAPRVLEEVALDGQVQDSRLVGDVLYLFTGGWTWWFAAFRGGEAGVAADVASPWTPGDWSVASYDVSDPAEPVKVDAVTFPAEAWGWDLHANVTDRRITISSAIWSTSGPRTRLVAVDASDPGGDLALGAEVEVAGSVMDRWGLDLDEATGTFRAVAAEGWNAGARLTVLSWPEPGAVTKLSELHVEVQESLTAARFDGPRGYLVTAARVDPLWVVDLRDPAHPAITGELEMPGQLDHLVPRGERLLALGHTNEAGKPFQLHVSHLDVTDPAQPALLTRRTFGPDWAFVPASADDLHKAFLVVGDLVIVPFEGWDAAQGWVGGTQLLTLAGDALTLGGFVPHAGAVQRAFPVGGAAPGVLAAFSNEKLQTIDATDRAAPFELASIDLSRSVTSVAVAGDVAAELTGEPWRGAGEVVVVPSADPDAVEPLARFPTGSAWGRLFREGAVAWTLFTDWRTGEALVEAYDLADPAAPVRRGRLALPRPPDGAWWWSSEAVKPGAALAVRQDTWSCDPSGCKSSAKLVVVDLSDPDAPALAATVELPPNAWTGGLHAVGTDVWFTQYAWYDASSVRYHVGRVALADPAHPQVGPLVNVPGEFFSASDDGGTIYTEEIAWPVVEPATGTGWSPRTRVHALELTSRGTARLAGTVELDGYFRGARRAGARAYTAGNIWSSTAGASPTGRLATVDLARMVKVDVQAVEGTWPQVLAAERGKVFVAQSYPVPSVLVYGTASGKPVFEQAVPTLGWVYEVVVEGGAAYVPAGPYGVIRISLSP